jgi:hypothetical protein
MRDRRLRDSRREIQQRISIKGGLIVEELIRSLGRDSLFRHGVFGRPSCIFVTAPGLVESAPGMMGRVLTVWVVLTFFDDFVGIDW